MSDPDQHPEPDWTRRCLPHHLNEIHGEPYMLRTTDSDESPWRMVKTRHDGFWTDTKTGSTV